MSLFKTYSPKVLWTTTLQLTNAIFRNPPLLQVEPSSYFKSVIQAHTYIRHDLSGTFDDTKVPDKKAETTVENIHDSLQGLEQLLFGEMSAFDTSLEGCCLYTSYLEQSLNKHEKRCVLL